MLRDNLPLIGQAVTAGMAYALESTLLCLLVLVFAQRGAYARPSEDLIDRVAGRHLTQASGNQGTISTNPAGPSQSACTKLGLTCCYSPTWWRDQQVAPSLQCLDGKLSSDITAEVLLQACEDGYIGLPCFTDNCGVDTAPSVTCNYYESEGDYTGNFPCLTQDFNGETLTVYDPVNLYPNNDELVWEDVQQGHGLPAEKACDGPHGTISMTGTYSKSSSWNVGIQLGAKALSNYEAKLTAGYSETYTQSDSSSVAVEVPDGHHGTLTKGTLVHHSIGWWNIAIDVGAWEGCSVYRIDNVSSDLIYSTDDDRFPTGYGTEVKPCQYPLRNGHYT